MIRTVATRARTVPLVDLPILEFPPDHDTRVFIDEQRSTRHSRLRWATRTALRPFAGDFALNGLLGTYPLHLLSTDQWRGLLGDGAHGRLLDVGAACGDVTAQLAPLFDSVTVTEVNRPMARRLHRRGWETHRLDVTDRDVPGGPFDVVTALNVLDRCSHPVSLLHRVVDATEPGGLVVVSVPLPHRPVWYDGPRLAAPRQNLPITGEYFEEACRSMASLVEHAGTTIVALARAPYLSGGDRRRPLYTLDDAIVVARRPDQDPPA
jgi:2-polyprenyl-3-methyl-5-hydroxy-6-metoxy-1,4-benzoquinol methylase